MTKFSLCMIVKNEEEFLSSCLQPIYKIANEIIIIDTGSTDKTKEIACQFTDRIYDFTWCNDFSLARNYSLAKASNDWILVLDADEIVTEFNHESIVSITRKTPPTVGRIQRVNTLEDQWGEKRITERISRFFNRQFFHYEGIIHEQIVHRSRNSYQTQPVTITVEHIGYNKEVIKSKAKLDRNITLLLQAIQTQPQDPYFHYQLGKSYYLAKDYVQANRSFQQALLLPVDFSYEYVEDLVESYGYSLINSQSYAEALTLEKYSLYYDNSPDFRFLLGLIYMNNAQFAKAVEYLLACTAMQEGKTKGVNSYLAFYNIGVIHEILGFRKEAIEYYRKCGDYELAGKRLALN